MGENSNLKDFFTKGCAHYAALWEAGEIVTVGIQVSKIVVGNHARTTFRVGVAHLDEAAFDALYEKVKSATIGKRPVVLAFGCDVNKHGFVISATVDLFPL